MVFSRTPASSETLVFILRDAMQTAIESPTHLLPCIGRALQPREGKVVNAILAACQADEEVGVEQFPQVDHDARFLLCRIRIVPLPEEDERNGVRHVVQQIAVLKGMKAAPPSAL